MTRGAVAKAVRLAKEKHPEQFCPRCLWRTGGGPCPRHRHAGVVVTTTDFASVNAAAILLSGRGVVLGARGFSAGRWTPAVDDGYTWAVLDPKGAPLVLCFDAFEAARSFCDFESGEVPPPTVTIRVLSDQRLADERRIDAWTFDYRWSHIGGYGKGRNNNE